MNFAHEKLTRALGDEALPMLQAHYDELTLNKDRIKLSPRWGAYDILQQYNRFVAFTAREEGRLVGYSAFFVDYHLHYSGTLVAVNDVFYLHPDARRGTTALRFLRYAEQQLRDVWAVDKIAYHFKAVNNFGPILNRLGYANEEGVAAKLL
jgi:GNAT superfamily N-acetyltransferase